jgi:serine/threonine-protein kinase
VLIAGGFDGKYAPSGHLLYASGSTVRAVPFDMKTMTVRGDPATVIRDILRTKGFTTGAASFSFSANGSLVHASVSETPVALVMIDKSGVRKPLNLPAGIYTHFRISPSGKHLIIEESVRTASIFELASESLRPLNDFHLRSIWSPDGQHIVFGSDRNRRGELFRERADGSGPAELVFANFGNGPGRQPKPVAWSPDGKAIVFDTSDIPAQNTWWIVPADGSKKPERLAAAPYRNAGRFSPDGRWIAYDSEETGEPQIYVQAFPADGTKYQISTKGGHHPIWAPDGKRLYYVNANEIHSVDTVTSPKFAFGKTTSLGIRVRALFGFVGSDRWPAAPYDVSPDGRYILAAQDPDSSDTGREPTSRINVTLNWLEELKLRVPVK